MIRRTPTLSAPPGAPARADLEDTFRTWFHPERARRMRLAMGAGAVPMMLFVFADLAYLGATTRFVALATARIAFAATSAWWVARAPAWNAATLERRSLAWAAFGTTVVLASVATRAPGFQPHALSAALVTLLLYLLVPSALKQVAACCIGFGVVYLLIVSRDGALHGADRVVILLTLFFANVIGAAAHQWLANVSRTEFLRLRAIEELHASRLSFLAATSHEIRSPLHSIVACVELLERSELAREQRVLVELIRSCSDGVVGLLQEAVEEVRGDRSAPVLELVTFDPRALVAEVGALTRVRAAMSHVHVDVKVDCAVPEWVRADRARIRQVLVNLAENAIAHGARSRIELAMAMSETKNGEDSLVVSVADDGPGVPVDVRESIFQSFVQLEPARRTGRGMGLGLAICDRLARAMHGRIEVDDAPGGGARFRLFIAVSAGFAADVAPERPVPVVQPLEILLVEDDIVSGRLTSLLLERDGHSVLHVPTAERGLDALRSRTFDVAIVDVQLPGMSGIELVKRLRSEEIGVPIVAASAHIAAAEHEELRGAGCAQVLAKPVALADLRWALASIGATRARDASAPRLSTNDTPTFDEASVASTVHALGADAVARLLELFAETTPTTLAELRGAASRSEHTEVVRLAHRLASAASSASLARCARAAAEVETGSKGGDVVPEAAVGALVDAHAVALIAIRGRVLALRGADESHALVDRI